MDKRAIVYEPSIGKYKFAPDGTPEPECGAAIWLNGFDYICHEPQGHDRLKHKFVISPNTMLGGNL